MKNYNYCLVNKISNYSALNIDKDIKLEQKILNTCFSEEINQKFYICTEDKCKEFRKTIFKCKLNFIINGIFPENKKMIYLFGTLSNIPIIYNINHWNLFYFIFLQICLS